MGELAAEPGDCLDGARAFWREKNRRPGSGSCDRECSFPTLSAPGAASRSGSARLSIFSQNMRQFRTQSTANNLTEESLRVLFRAQF